MQKQIEGQEKIVKTIWGVRRDLLEWKDKQRLIGFLREFGKCVWGENGEVVRREIFSLEDWEYEKYGDFIYGFGS